ncbi:plexin-C1 [Hyperolius riggenbachi]|uniref:plexin-C1 n=1 Tax=Hyperolius riggenbachi TaxID=752182 RepID=UPI0035A32E88
MCPLFLLSILLCLIIRDTATEGSFTFNSSIHNIAVGSDRLVVATGETLHLFNNTLQRLPDGYLQPVTKEHQHCQKGKIDSEIYYNKILVVYKDSVLSCWNTYSGICGEFRLSNLSALPHCAENVVSTNPKITATGFILEFKDDIYFVTASKPTTNDNLISVRKKRGDSTIGTDGKSLQGKNGKLDLNFADAVWWGEKNAIFPYYLADGTAARVVVVDVELDQIAEPKPLALYNLACGPDPQRVVILSSFALNRSGDNLWAAVFTTSNSTLSPDRTAVCIFNFTALKQNECSCWDFQEKSCPCPTLPSLLSEPIISHGDLSAVYAMEVQKSVILFLGTGNGQLLKVTLDSNYSASCSEVLYEFQQEAPVFRTMHLDPIDNNYLYVATVTEIKRLKIAKCEQYDTCNECLAANDPHCGWCQTERRCTMQNECQSSVLMGNWLERDYGKCLGIHVFTTNQKQVKLTVKKNPNLFAENTAWSCALKNMATVLCNGTNDSSNNSSALHCSCQFPVSKVSDNDVLTVKASSNGITVMDHFQFKNCSQYSQFRCSDCISSGCLWCIKEAACRSPLAQCEDYADEAKCKIEEDKAYESSPSNAIVRTVLPNRVTSAGKSNVLIIGENLQNLSRMFLVGSSGCKPQEVLVRREDKNNTHAFISLPPSRKEIKRLCVHLQKCQEGVNIHYVSFPSCSVNVPNSVWLSGGRNVSISGKNLDLMDNISVSEVTFLYKDINCFQENTLCYYNAPSLTQTIQNVNVRIRIADNTTECGLLRYLNNPSFNTYSVLNDVDDEIELRIKKARDELHIRADEINVVIYYEKYNLTCEIKNITENSVENTIFCKARKTFTGKLDVSKMEVKVSLGNFTVTLKPGQQSSLYLYILLLIPVLVVVVIATCVITRYKSKQLSEKLSKQLELLECDIRQEIRDGFAELQIDREVTTVETLGTIPFFDYKHFALKTFFPESDGVRQNFSEKLCENVPSPFQKNKRNTEGESIADLEHLFQNQNFLVLMIHTLEKQKDFTIKDRCLFASFLTIIFQNNLLYLTGLLETLIKDLIEQSSNKNPKLMLRRTETVVEKLLTNWMATCLYGFLRESVGEPLYGLVHTLNQRIHKGPIDVITCKALYTLNEDWLLWQSADFKNVEINVHLPMPEGESMEDANQCLKVTVLDCDTIGQIKEKILQSYLLKNGYSLGLPLCDICLELHYGQSYKELSDLDSSTIVKENGLSKLNTVKHYKIENGATIKIIPKKDYNPVKDYSKGYFHLESPESEETEDQQNMENKGKQKFKVKELYLTKLLSTKVAIHASVEKLFRSIWKIPHNKPPIAIKYFFDFLDNQGEIRKISDPDVLHIWKTNSLPLRFWINILKNPQFVLDIKKTALLESCLSVVAQAFMDGFSLTEQQLGKSAPTNKLLYAKDIPQFKEEVKAYYQEIREAPTLSSAELTEFLIAESKKHEHEFKVDVAILELSKYIEKYSDVIVSALEKETGFDSELKILLHLKKISQDKNLCPWE